MDNNEPKLATIGEVKELIDYLLKISQVNGKDAVYWYSLCQQYESEIASNAHAIVGFEGTILGLQSRLKDAEAANGELLKVNAEMRKQLDHAVSMESYQHNTKVIGDLQRHLDTVIKEKVDYQKKYESIKNYKNRGENYVGKQYHLHLMEQKQNEINSLYQKLDSIKELLE